MREKFTGIDIPAIKNLSLDISAMRAKIDEQRAALGRHEIKLRAVCGAVSVISLVAEILFFLAAAYGLLAGVLIRLGVTPDSFSAWTASASSIPLNILTPFNDAIRNIQRLTEIGSAAVFHFILAVAAALFATVLLFAHKIFRRISRNAHPFDRQNIRYMRIITALCLCSGLIQPILFLIALLQTALTLIGEYGHVLQQKADATIDDQEEIIFSLAELTENKSSQTGKHIRRVSEYSRILAEGLGLPAEKVEEIRLASVLHDIGKLMIDQSILEKPGKLTDEEYAEIKKHVVYGDMLLSNVKSSVLATARLIARDHHERWDGRGYARNTAGGATSTEGRIVAVADVFDALSSRRSYKEAWKLEDARDEILKNSGTQFDPAVVKVFESRFGDIEKVALRLREPAS